MAVEPDHRRPERNTRSRSTGVPQTRTREVRPLPPHRHLDRRVLRLIRKSRIASQEWKQHRMPPHDGVDVDKSADENHIPALQRDALILDPHTASSWIELRLQPETANTDEDNLGPRPPVRQTCRRSPARLPAGVAGGEPSRGSAPEHGHIQSGGAVSFVVRDRGDDDRCRYADRHTSRGLRRSRCTASEYRGKNEQEPYSTSHNRYPTPTCSRAARLTNLGEI
jgi:hypothetical protein